MKTVSMVMPVYNAGKYIATMLDSILAQTYGCIELIAGYDSSPDNTLEVLRSYLPKFEKRGFRLIVAENKERLGTTGGINRALQSVTGDYLTFPDSDDRMHPDYCAVMVDALERNPQYGYAACDAYMDARREYSYRPEYDGLDIAECTILDLIPRAPWFLTVRMDFFRKCFPENKLYPHPTSHELPIRLPLSCERFLHVNQPLYTYAAHDDSYILSRHYSYHTGIPYWDSVELLGYELIERMHLTEERKGRLRLANRIASLRTKLDVTIKTGGIGLYKAYAKEFSSSLNQFNPKLCISTDYNWQESWNLLYPHLPAIAANAFFPNRIEKNPVYQILKDSDRYILYGAGKQCREGLPSLIGASLRPTEIWDAAPENVGKLRDIAVLAPHSGYDAHTPIVVTIANPKIAKKAAEDLNKLGYQRVIQGQEVNDFLSLLTAKITWEEFSI